VLWAAGVRAVSLAEEIGLPVDRQGRVKVLSDCSVDAHPEVFCIGDAAAFVPEGSEQPLPGVSPVAIQQGQFVARQICLSLDGLPRRVFKYVDRGSMATIGRSRAVAEIGRLRLSGFVAWAAWLMVHIVLLIDFRNRLLVLIDWTFAYFVYRRGSRLITGHRLDAGAPVSLRALGPAPAREASPSA
jgi:NADH dehydrogenase